MSTAINTVNSNSTNVNTVSGAIANVNHVGGSITNVNNVGSNIAGVNAFAERYRVASSDPSSSLNAGDLAFNTSGNVFKYYDGSNWQQITAGGITDIAQDSTPELGGNLDVLTNSLISTSNRNIAITPNGSGKVVLDGISYPTSDGTSGQAVVTDGSGNLSFATASSAEVYGFNKNSSGQLIITTTNQGADNISSATFATFDDVLFSASGFVFSIDTNGDLISTI